MKSTVTLYIDTPEIPSLHHFFVELGQFIATQPIVQSFDTTGFEAANISEASPIVRRIWTPEQEKHLANLWESIPTQSPPTEGGPTE